jgi:hypothetical protein
MPGCFADGLGVVIERLQLLEQGLEGLSLPLDQRQFAGGKCLQGRHGLK